MLEGKTALVTGSTSGIGLAIAERLAESGANVVINGFGEAAQIERLRGALAERTGVQVHYSAADMSRPEQIEAMMREA
jgi:3-hydroxybutyrate dehydrogenase